MKKNLNDRSSKNMTDPVKTSLYSLASVNEKLTAIREKIQLTLFEMWTSLQYQVQTIHYLYEKGKKLLCLHS